MAGSLRLSAIDLQWPGDVPALVPRLEALGYHRFWTTEHFSPDQSGSPTLLAAVAAGLTTRMRVGTAGVLLRYQSPLTVAQDFNLLELLYPGRIDLGVANGFRQGAVGQALLDGRAGGDDAAEHQRVYDRKVGELTRLVRRQPGGASGIAPDEVGPAAPGTPPLWVCGLGAASARLAAGLGVAYARHHARKPGDPSTGPEVLARYRDCFVPNEWLDRPTAVVVCYGACAESAAVAARLWRERLGLPFTTRVEAGLPVFGPTAAPVPSFVGDPERCREQLLAIAAEHGVDEIVVQLVAPDFPSRLRGYEMLADACR